MASIVIIETWVSPECQMGDKTKALHSQQLFKRVDTASNTKVLVIVYMVSQLRKSKEPCIAAETLVWGVALEFSKAVEGLLRDIVESRGSRRPIRRESTVCYLAWSVNQQLTVEVVQANMRVHSVPIRHPKGVDPLESSIGQITKRPEEILGGSMGRTVTVLNPFEYTAELSAAPVAVKRAVVQAEGLLNTVAVRAPDKSKHMTNKANNGGRTVPCRTGSPPSNGG